MHLYGVKAGYELPRRLASHALYDILFPSLSLYRMAHNRGNRAMGAAPSGIRPLVLHASHHLHLSVNLAPSQSGRISA